MTAPSIPHQQPQPANDSQRFPLYDALTGELIAAVPLDTIQHIDAYWQGIPFFWNGRHAQRYPKAVGGQIINPSTGQPYAPTTAPPQSTALSFRETASHINSTGGMQIKGMRPGDWKKSAPRVDWLIQGILPTPALTLLHSGGKLGKSTMLGSWLKALETGDDWAGHKAQRARVLYLTEENASTHSEIVEEVGLGDDADIFFYSLDWKPDEWLTGQFLLQLGAAVIECAADLVVVDTLGAWLDLEDINSYTEFVKLMKVLRRAAHELGIALVVVHHSRKMGGNALDTALGSMGAIAGPDSIIQYNRKGHETTYTLTFHSRFRESRKSLSVDYANGVVVETNASTTTVDMPKKISIHAARLPLLFKGEVNVYRKHTELVAVGAELDPPLDNNKVTAALNWGQGNGECVVKDAEGRYCYLAPSLLLD